ncbi:hypothetical protein G9A89_013186 [Geosiphon pyriformis]|nr:hypothetical protein G9A89_013186 [Geosiphon pyriformis]
MELVNPIAGGFGPTSAGLENWPDMKKKGPLGLTNIGVIDGKFLKSWGSEMKSEASSVDSLLDLKNMKNTVIEETSYADSNDSVINDIKNDTTPKKMHTRMYVLD